MHSQKFKHASASKEVDYEMVAFGDADDGNIFELDDAAHRPEPARPPVKLQSAEVIIKNLARRTVHSRAWKEVGLTDEVGHKVARRSLV